MTNKENFIGDPHEALISELKKIAECKELMDGDKIRKDFKTEHYIKGQFFVMEGDIPGKLGFIIKGLMKYYYIDAKGDEWIKHFSAENDFVASYGSFLYQTPSLYFIEAMEETTILSIPYNVFINNINNSILWCAIARKYTEKIYYEKEKREASFLKLDGTQRYLNFLEGYKHLTNRISVKEIASFLGLTPVSLSRIRSKISREINKC